MLIASPVFAQEATLSPSIVKGAEGLIERGLKDQVGLQFVEDLTTEIGPRLAGSDAEARARDWAVAELKALGFSNVRVDNFTIPFWSRVKESAHVVADRFGRPWWCLAVEDGDRHPYPFCGSRGS